MDTLMEQSKKSTEMLESIREESKQGRETLGESLRLLGEAVEKLVSTQQSGDRTTTGLDK